LFFCYCCSLGHSSWISDVCFDSFSNNNNKKKNNKNDNDDDDDNNNNNNNNSNNNYSLISVGEDASLCFWEIKEKEIKRENVDKIREKMKENEGERKKRESAKVERFPPIKNVEKWMERRKEGYHYYYYCVVVIICFFLWFVLRPSLSLRMTMTRVMIINNNNEL